MDRSRNMTSVTTPQVGITMKTRDSKKTKTNNVPHVYSAFPTTPIMTNVSVKMKIMIAYRTIEACIVIRMRAQNLTTYVFVQHWRYLLMIVQGRLDNVNALVNSLHVNIMT
jgi:hypothetical protein